MSLAGALHCRAKLTNLGIESPGISYVSLESLCAKFRVQSLISETMHVDDMLCYVEVNFFVAFVQNNEKQVESTHDRSGHRNVSSKSFLAIVPAADGVRGGKNRRTCVERGVYARLGDRYSLLFHCFMNGNLVRDVHLVEFVDGADPIVR